MTILSELRKELKANVDPTYDYQIFYKQKIKAYGVRYPIVRKIAKREYKQLTHLPKKELFELCESLLKTGYQEDFVIGVQWAKQRRKEFTAADFKTFERWLKNYVTTWGMCDDLCGGILNYYTANFPKTIIPKTKQWAKSKNLWVRRGAAVSYIGTIKSRYGAAHHLKDMFTIAKILLKDDEDLVQKGYGWMLKAASIVYEKEVFDFVMRYKNDMPRTALRYAIEHYPKAMKKKAMAKD